MKKIYSIICTLCIVNCALIQAQSIEIMREGAAFAIISPSAKYIAGNISDYAVYYGLESKVAKTLEGEMLDDGGCFVWDLNDLGQLAVDWKKQAAIWTETDGYTILPHPEGLTKDEKAYSAVRCITNDGKTLVVSFADPTTSVYVYTLGEDGNYSMEKLPMPTEDPIFHQVPQFAAPMGINDDATRIMGRYRIDTGLEELPFVWEKDENGKWNLRWVALNFIVKGGETDAVYPGEFEFDGSNFDVESGEWQEEYDKAWAEYDQLWLDYEATLRASATGYYYNAKGSLSGMRMSRNGKYANAQISYELTNETYPAVIDIDADTVYVFTCRPGGGCVSVTNEGVISILAVLSDFSWSYVSSIDNPKVDMTITEYTMQRTNGAINLADYMIYETPNGPQLAEGNAHLACYGDGFVSWQYNGFGDNMRYETIVVKFDGPVDNETIYSPELEIFPNPTKGVLNISEELTDVQIFDLTGRVIYAAPIVQTTIDLSNIVSGTYLLVANKQGQKVSAKIMINR
ncbi:MAG: T9SS type A sorting domain-containing protein [Paludibacteraceae bacterium]|nr:T9SS type A sorting domain-containing protein [Paludibacteraceae bacterium]